MVKVPSGPTERPSVLRTARFFVCAGLGLALALPITATTTHAAPPPAPSAPTTAPTTVTVRPGDSLAAIAARHGVRLSALLQANSLTVTSVIHPGQTLVVPAGAVPPRSAPAAGTPARPAAPVAPAVAGGGRYTVVAGDTLSGIARRHGVRIGALLAANSMTVTSLIRPGQILVVPAGAATPGAPAVTTPAPSTTPPAAVPAPANSSLQRVLDFLRLQVGVPYRFFAAGPDAYDCSGLVVAAFRQVGVTLPHQSRAQARIGTPVDWRTAPIMPGDLVFTSAIDDPRFITHVGIALSSTTWIHAVGRGRTVSIGALPAAHRIMAVQRIALP
jgi:LysM repeat protein